MWKFQNLLYYLQMNIKATRKNVTNDFLINFRYVFINAKTTQWMPENVASRRILTKMVASVFILYIKQYQFFLQV